MATTQGPTTVSQRLNLLAPDFVGCVFKNPVSLTQRKIAVRCSAIGASWKPETEASTLLDSQTSRAPETTRSLLLEELLSAQPMLVKIPCPGESCVLKRPQISFSENDREKGHKILWKGQYIGTQFTDTPKSASMWGTPFLRVSCATTVPFGFLVEQC